MAEKGSSPNKRIKFLKKKHWDAEEKRRQWKEINIQLRKVKKSLQLFNRRMGNSSNQPYPMSALYKDDAEAISYIQQLDSTIFATYPAAALGVEVIEAGVVSRLVGCLTRDDSELQCVAAYLLMSITAQSTIEQTQMVIECKPVSALISLLSSPNVITTYYVLLILSNIAGASEGLRSELLRANILPLLLELLRSSTELPVIAIGSYCLSQFSQDIQEDKSEIYSRLFNLLRQHKDEKVVVQVCWALSHFLEVKTTDVFLGQEVCLRLVDLLAHESEEIVRAALSVVEQILSGDDAQVDVIVSCSLLPRLHHMLVHCDGMQAEISSVFVRLTASNNIQVQSAIDAFFPMLVSILRTGSLEAKENIVCAILNITAKLNHKHTKAIVQLGCIEFLCDLLKVPAIDMIFYVLYTITNILENGKSEACDGANNVYAKEIEAQQGLEKIEMLQNHGNEDISEIANYIIDTYFNSEEANSEVDSPRMDTTDSL